MLKQSNQRNFVSIDGLRGYLAISVFFHHAYIYLNFLSTGIWLSPKSNFFNLLGQASVSLFFMITGFLFLIKIEKTMSLRWDKLYISRLLRIMPMYLFSLSVAIFISLFYTKFSVNINESVYFLMCWLFFGALKNPNFNNFNISLIFAHVTWTLAVEWLFYLALPVLLIISKFRKKFLLTSLVLLIITSQYNENLIRLIPFYGGFLAVFIYKNDRIVRISKRNSANLVPILCITFLLIFFNTAYNILAQLIITVLFIFVVCRNESIRILCHPISQFLGKISYSIYLLHGIILFVTFKIAIPAIYFKSFSKGQYWLTIILVLLFLIIVSNLTYEYIEKPFNSKTLKVTKSFRTALYKFKKVLSS